MDRIRVGHKASADGTHVVGLLGLRAGRKVGREVGRESWVIGATGEELRLGLRMSVAKFGMNCSSTRLKNAVDNKPVGCVGDGVSEDVRKGVDRCRRTRLRSRMSGG